MLALGSFSAMVFAVGTSWFVNDPRASIGFSVFLLWGSLWGMPLLFLVSGMGVRYAMRSRTAWAFAAERLRRLGIPFATGLVLLVPPMFYLQQLAQPGIHQPYGRFWLAFLNVPLIARGLCGPTGLPVPARQVTRRTTRAAPCRSSRWPSADEKTGPSLRSPMAGRSPGQCAAPAGW